MWKKISSKKLFTHPRITLVEDEVGLPSGKTTQYLRFENTGTGAMVIAQRNDGKILVQKEYSYPVDEKLYQFPGGGVEQGESLKVGAARELAEEGGYKANLMKELGWFYVNNRRTDSKIHTFFASDLSEHKLPHDDEEEFESFWFTESEIDELIKNGGVTNYSLLAGWALYKAK